MQKYTVASISAVNRPSPFPSTSTPSLLFRDWAWSAATRAVVPLLTAMACAASCAAAKRRPRAGRRRRLCRRLRRPADQLRKEIRGFEATLREMHVKGGGTVVGVGTRKEALDLARAVAAESARLILVRVVSPVERLVDAHHRQPTPVGVDPVSGPGRFLLLHQQVLAGGEPFLGRHHLGQVHACGHLGSSQSDVVAPGGPASTLGTYSSSCSRPSKVRLLTISRATSG